MSRRHSKAAGASFVAALNRLSAYSIISAANYTVAGSNAASFPDLVTAGTGIRAIDASHALSQASAGLQVPIPTASSNLNGKMVGVFNAASYYDSTAAASAWSLLHDGTGYELFYVLDRTSVAAGVKYQITTNGAAAPEGFSFRHNGTTVTTLTYNNSANVVNRAGATAATGPWYYDMGYTNNASPETFFYDKTTLTSSGADLAAPSTTASATTLRLGALPAGTGKMISNFALLVVFARVLTAGERTVVQNAIALEYGIT